MTTKPNISLISTVQRNPNMVASKLDEELVMMSVENGEYYGIDETGSRIWELIESPQMVSALIDSLLDEFEVEQAECENDTFEFLEELYAKNLLIVK